MTLKQKLALGGAFALLLVISAGIATAQVSRPVILSWELPTLATDGTPLTGSQAITKVQVFLNTVPIQDTSSMQPTVELGPTVITNTQNFPVPVGGTLYARVKVCNSTGCGAFSGQVTKTFPSAVPGPATNLKIETGT